ncbi:MAG: HD domain-containing protein [Candidatus Saccharimonadales bacterium]
MTGVGPEGFDPTGSSNMESIVTPEGYDVSTVAGAEAYLTEIHGRVLPEAGGLIDASTGYHLSLALQKEARAALYNEDGDKQQNVAEHAFKLAGSAVWKASHERDDLDIGKVSIMAIFHDYIEAYAGDTVIEDLEALESKFWREKAGMTLLSRDLEGNGLLKILEEYENNETPESRYVNAMDKVEAYQFSLNNKAKLHRQRWEDFGQLAEKALPKAVIDKTAFGLMQDVLIQLGRKWHDWGCMPFDGDPEEIVGSLASKVEADYLAEQTLSRQIEAVVYQYTGDTSLPDEGVVQPKINADQANQFGNVVLLASRKKDDTMPEPPGTPAAMQVG